MINVDLKKQFYLGFAGFFSITLNHDTLESHYLTNFALIQHHKYSLTELNEMIPFERQVYLELLKNHIEEENNRIKERELARNG